MVQLNESVHQCPGCGSSAAARRSAAQKNQTEFPDEQHDPYFKECKRCGSTKCNMCDMGDDVECISCDNGCGDDD